MTENYKKLADIFEKVLQLSLLELNDTEPLDTVSAWDSFNALVLITDIEKEFSVKFTMDEIVSVKTLLDIKNLLKKNNVEV